MSQKRGGLGRNLTALLGNSYSPNNNSAPETSKLALGDLQPGKYQPRSAMDDTALQELAESIKQQGLLQPLVVRALENGRHEIIAGERRWRACQLAGLSDVPVIIRQVDDETAMAIALVENLQRENLNPVDQARAMERLTNEFSLTHQQIAIVLSKSRTAVSNYLRLLSLAPEVTRFLEQGHLDMGHARALLMLAEAQQIQVAQLVIAKNLSVRETEKLVTRVKEEKITPPLDDKPSPTSPLLQARIQKLSHLLKTKVNLKEGKAGNGSIVIHYDSLTSRDAVLQKIIAMEEAFEPA
jgi:ParB family chromosome partitioning protein